MDLICFSRCGTIPSTTNFVSILMKYHIIILHISPGVASYVPQWTSCWSWWNFSSSHRTSHMSQTEQGEENRGRGDILKKDKIENIWLSFLLIVSLEMFLTKISVIICFLACLGDKHYSLLFCTFLLSYRLLQKHVTLKITISDYPFPHITLSTSTWFVDTKKTF